jgi:hypothetical protein
VHELNDTRRRPRFVERDLLVTCALVAVAVAVRVGALLAHKHLSLDDGAYGVTTLDMRHGTVPYRDLFASQGPLHYPLLYVGDLLGLRFRNGPRVTPFLSGIVAAIALWRLALRLGVSRAAAFGAGLLMATTGSILWVTGPVSADGPAVAFTVCAVLAAAAYRATPSRARAVLVGVLFGAALATKPLVFPAVVPIAWWLRSRRKPVDAVLAAGAAVCFWFATAIPWGLSRVWDQSIRFHLDKQSQSPPLTQLGKLLTTLFQRDLVLLVLVALTCVALVVCRPRIVRERANDARVMGVWAVLTALVLVFEKLLLVSHVATIVAPLALLVALRPAPRSWLIAALFVTVPIQAYQLSDIVVPRSYPAAERAVVAQLRALPKGARVIGDITGIGWQAGRTSPPLLNDNSNARIETGSEKASDVLAGAKRDDTCAVVIWSFRYDGMAGLREGLTRLGYTKTFDAAPDRQLWIKTACDPNGQPTATAAPGRSPG